MFTCLLSLRLVFNMRSYIVIHKQFITPKLLQTPSYFTKEILIFYFQQQEYGGSLDGVTPLFYSIDPPEQAVAIRFIPTQYQTVKAMKLELFGQVIGLSLKITLLVLLFVP